MLISDAIEFVTCGQPLDPAAKSRAEAARTMVKAALIERDRYLGKNGLDPEIWNPAANWDLSQPFYGNSRWLIDGGDPAQLRGRSSQFTGRRVPAAGDTPDMLAVAQYRNFHEHLPAYLQISPAPLMGESGWMMDGVIVNYDTMAYWERLAILYQTGLLDRNSPRCLKSRARILEIGGGYGGLAHLLRTAIGTVEYTIVDLPESLIYSAMYLSACFEDGFRFIPNYRFRELAGERFDLVINTLSMSEMSEKQVRAYCRQLAGMTPRFFEQNHDCRNIGLGNAQDIIGDYFPARLDVRNREGYPGFIQGFAHIWSPVPLPPDMDRIVPGLLTSTAITEFPSVDGYRIFSYFGIVCAVPAEGVDLTRDLTQITGSLSFESLAAAQAHMANIT